MTTIQLVKIPLRARGADDAPRMGPRARELVSQQHGVRLDVRLDAPARESITLCRPRAGRRAVLRNLGEQAQVVLVRVVEADDDVDLTWSVTRRLELVHERFRTLCSSVPLSVLMKEHPVVENDVAIAVHAWIALEVQSLRKEDRSAKRDQMIIVVRRAFVPEEDERALLSQCCCEQTIVHRQRDARVSRPRVLANDFVTARGKQRCVGEQLEQRSVHDDVRAVDAMAGPHADEPRLGRAQRREQRLQPRDVPPYIVLG